jgi:hypothetical protein
MSTIAVQLCVTFASVVVGIFLASILYSPTQLRTPAPPGAHRIHPLESADTRPHLPNTGAIHLNRGYGSSILARKGGVAHCAGAKHTQPSPSVSRFPGGLHRALNSLACSIALKVEKSKCTNAD